MSYSRTYQTTGIILQGMPMGEFDRLLSILTPDYGLIRAIAPGARKYKSKLRGRSELFVVNEMLILKGRSLDKITQAETQRSYPGLSQDLGKLTASQYLAEVVLALALSEQPQTELYEIFLEHLQRLEKIPNNSLNSVNYSLVFAHLSQAIFHLLAVAGIAPQVHHCCISDIPLVANFQEKNWQVGFSFESGGLIDLRVVKNQASQKKDRVKESEKYALLSPHIYPTINHRIGAMEVTLLQHLAQKKLPQIQQLNLGKDNPNLGQQAWAKIEFTLRSYLQHHIGKKIRSAALLDF